jgi:CHASE3 domain sensor protein
LTEDIEPKKKILETENLLKSLSEEMVKLKSASQHYDETQKNFQSISESLEKISQTHNELTDNIKQFLSIMEKNVQENKRNQEIIQKASDETKDFIKTTMEGHRTAVNESLSQQNVFLTKRIGQLKSLFVLGISLEAVIIIILLLLLFF